MIDKLLLRVRCLQRLQWYCTSLARIRWKLLKGWWYKVCLPCGKSKIELRVLQHLWLVEEHVLVMRIERCKGRRWYILWSCCCWSWGRRSDLRSWRYSNSKCAPSHVVGECLVGYLCAAKPLLFGLLNAIRDLYHKIGLVARSVKFTIYHRTLRAARKTMAALKGLILQGHLRLTILGFRS
jgi:hypothetical protein